MLISLPTGKTIEISLEEWLRSEEENPFQRFVAKNKGEQIENAFYGSHLENPDDRLDPLIEDIELPDDIEEIDQDVDLNIIDE
jgi:hypothetical protein